MTRALPEGGAVAYHLNAGFPKHLVRAAMEVVGDWNEVFMRGWRAARDVPLPAYDALRVDCQTADPTRYCFCGSPDDEGGACEAGEPGRHGHSQHALGSGVGTAHPIGRFVGGGPGARLVALDPSRKSSLLFEQVMPNLDAGYSSSQRIGDLPGLDPYGNPTFVLFEGLTGLVAVRRATVSFGAQR